MRFYKIISCLPVAALMLVPGVTMAATASTNPLDKQTDYNVLLITLVGLMLILLFVIGMLANTMRLLGMVLRDKNRKEKQGSKGVVASILLFVACLMPAFHSFAADATAEASKAEVVQEVSPYIQGIPRQDFYAIISMITLELAVIFALVIYIRILLRLIKEQPHLQAAAKAVVKKSWFWDNFNKAVSVEKEADIMLDHDYDGIQELDNSLPPWWKYGFYLTIVVSVIYIYRFHVSHDGMSQHEEFVAAMEKGEEEKRAYLAKSANNVDESNVTTLTDAAEVAEGKEIFIKTCAPCHLADGGGVVGPNLTDDYWLHGGGIKDVFKSIKYGWQDKGMKSWKDDFSPKQIQELASFVKSLKGTKPAVAKAPQGELYIEGNAAPQADSTKAKTDSVKTGKVASK